MNPLEMLKVMLSILTSDKEAITKEMRNEAAKITDMLLFTMKGDAEQMKKEYSKLIQP